MIRTQIQLTEKQARALRGRARQEGISLAEMIRRCIDRSLDEEGPDRAGLYEAAATLIGQFRDRRGATDLAEKHDDYLDDAGRKMNRVFVDTSALLAILNPDDAQHAAARAAFERLASTSATLFTTSYVLVELSALLGPRMGIEAVQKFRQSFMPLLDILWVDRELHEAGLDLVTHREAGHLSLVDAISFVTIRTRKLDGAFTCNRHFREAGFDTVP